MRNSRTRMLVAAAGAVCALGMVTACSGGKTNDAAQTDAQSSASATGSAEDYNLKFAQCMRDAGFNVSDPSDNKDVRADDVGGDPAAFNAASQECEKKLGPAPGADAQSQDLNDPDTLAAGVKMAECLRADGYDVKDPEAGKGLSLDLGSIPESAIQKCASASAPGGGSTPEDGQ